MQIAGSILLVVVLSVARYVGQLYGWYYHALLLAALGGVLAVLFRVVAPKPPEPMRELPPTDDPEGRKILEQIRVMHEDLVHSYPAMRRDMMLLPILACAPAVLILCILRQRSYLPDYSIWLRLSFVPFILYFVFRFLIPKQSKKRA